MSVVEMGENELPHREAVCLESKIYCVNYGIFKISIGLRAPCSINASASVWKLNDHDHNHCSPVTAKLISGHWGADTQCVRETVSVWKSFWIVCCYITTSCVREKNSAGHAWLPLVHTDTVHTNTDIHASVNISKLKTEHSFLFLPALPNTLYQYCYTNSGFVLQYLSFILTYFNFSPSCFIPSLPSSFLDPCLCQDITAVYYVVCCRTATSHSFSMENYRTNHLDVAHQVVEINHNQPWLSYQNKTAKNIVSLFTCDYHM